MDNMKKYIVLALSAALFGMTSCTEDQMDKVNVNNENPPASLVSANLQITDAIMSTAFTTVSGGTTEPTSDSGIIALAVVASLAAAGAVIIKKSR